MSYTDILMNIFPGISSLFTQDPVIAFARIALIIAGFFLAYYGFKRTLEPLIMVPMGIGMICINAGVLFLGDGQTGTLFLSPLVSNTSDLVNIMQVNFLQPIYNLTFSNSLIACVVFIGVGAMCEIGFILANPWTSIIIAIFAECGTFVALILGVNFGLAPNEAAALASIGGADGPMVLFTSMMLAPNLFVPISVIAYLYLSLTYAGYPAMVKMIVPKKYRGEDVIMEFPDVTKKSKFIFIIVACGLLCILLPMAAPLIMSFFLGMAIKESEIVPYQDLVENTLMYMATLLLGLLLGCLCEASTLLNPKVAIIVVLGILALTVSGITGLIGGWVVYWFKKRQGKDYNPVIGIAGVSCVPTTAKIAQHAAEDENPFAMILPLAMGANIAGVIVSAIACGIMIATINFL
jgi:oxaloacetate decarboxylase beta subunit